MENLSFLFLDGFQYLLPYLVEEKQSSSRPNAIDQPKWKINENV